MARALNEFSKENADALLTASVLLAWNSPDELVDTLSVHIFAVSNRRWYSNAFAQYLSGIITVRAKFSLHSMIIAAKKFIAN